MRPFRSCPSVRKEVQSPSSSSVDSECDSSARVNCHGLPPPVFFGRPISRAVSALISAPSWLPMREGQRHPL